MKIAFAALLLGATLGFAGTAVGDDARAEYSRAKESADADYQAAKDKCGALRGNDKDVCVAEAKATHDKAQALAEAKYKGTPKAEADARAKEAAADYAVAKTKCSAMTGEQKDACIKDAKADQTAAKADAKAERKAAEARREAREDKDAAAYKAARERCDLQPHAQKGQCLDAAKAKFVNH